MRYVKRGTLYKGVCIGIVASVGMLTGCAEQSRTSASAQHVPIQTFAGGPTGGNNAEAGVRDTHPKFNVPSAPLNTPLCGVALQEQASMGAALYSQSLQAGNPCTQNACFQPLTGTFIAQDGRNSVCR